MGFRARIVLSISAAVLPTAVLVLAPMLFGVEGLIRKGTVGELEQVELRFRSALEDRVQSAMTMAALVAEIPDVQAAMAAGDRDRLAGLFQAGFARMKAERGIFQFQFHAPDARSVYRVHQPEKFGDDLSQFRATVVAANATRSALAGLERGRAGLGIRGLAPIAHAGAHVGTVEIGLTLDDAFFADPVRGSDTRMEFYLLPDRSIEGISEADAAIRRLGGNVAGAPLLDAGAVAAVVDDRGELRVVKLDGRSFAATAFPVADFAGTPAAVVHVLVPRAAYLAIAGQMRMLAAGAGAIALLAGLGLAVVLGGRVSRALRELIEGMKRMAGGDLGIDFDAGCGRDGELGEMCAALAHFRDGLIDEQRLQAERAAAQALQKDVVERLAGALSRLAAGDMGAEIDAPLGDGDEGLRGDYNATVLRLAELIADISDMAGTITGSVEAINSAAHDLSHRTENAAATLEETAAALQDLTTLIGATAEGARGADEIGRDAIAKARTGARIVGETVQAMGEIDASADAIARIIHVIDDIAFQTGLLALNAGVEAARAGGAGSGFGVVASEVRALAQRTADAAHEIGDLIATSGARVKQGVGLVGRTGEALDAIVAAVEGVTERVSAIAALAAEQSGGLGEINTAVGQLDQVTQDNAAKFEETTAASDTLHGEAERLRSLVARFHTGSGAQPGHRARPAA